MNVETSYVPSVEDVKAAAKNLDGRFGSHSINQKS